MAEASAGASLSIDEYALLVEQVPAMLWRANQHAECRYCSQSWQSFTGTSRLGIGWLEPIHPEDRHKYMSAYRTAATRRDQFEVQYRLRRYDGVYRWVLDRAAPVFSVGRFDGYVGVSVDVTNQVEEPEAGHTHMRGLLPICAHCKSIRDDHGHWHSVEEYMSDHTDTELSHGICPDCLKKLYPDLQDVQDAVRSGIQQRAERGSTAGVMSRSAASAAAAKLAAALESAARMHDSQPPAGSTGTA